MSFLQKLKGQGVGISDENQSKEEEALKGVARLEVDLYQAPSEIVIYANMPGVNVKDINVSIEGDDDIVVITGERKRPEKLAYKKGKVPPGKYFAEDIVWGACYRKIILPEPIDKLRSEAQLKNGILVLKLPMVDQESIEPGSRLKVKDLSVDH